MFYLTTHSTHFIYGYMASDIWLRTILIVKKETRCSHIGYYFRLTARVLLYAPSHRQDSTYHGLCYTSRLHDAVISCHLSPGWQSSKTISGRYTLEVIFNLPKHPFNCAMYKHAVVPSGDGSWDGSFMMNPLR